MNASESGSDLATHIVLHACGVPDEPKFDPNSALAAMPKQIRGRSFGLYWAFGPEADSIETARGQIDVYSTEAGDAPFSLAVFGPPGSGKSFMVEQLGAALNAKWKKDKRKLECRLTTINLTQVETANELATALAGALSLGSSKHMPLVFFDEFDTLREGTPLGWLPWFLAPMNDGRYRLNGVDMPVGRAIFVFAGGTSHRADDFTSRGDPAFRSAKGPDFASRLGADIDITGPNAVDAIDLGHRRLRRALQLAYQIRALRKGFGGNAVQIDPELVEDLLEVGRYTHGSRSLALVMKAIRRKVTPPKGEAAVRIEHTHLPPTRALDALLDRGPLDPAAIGGEIHLSAGLDTGWAKKKVLGTWAPLGRRLSEEGAGIVFGGRLGARDDPAEEFALTRALLSANVSRRSPARRRGRTDAAPVRLRVFRRFGATPLPKKTQERDDLNAQGVEVMKLPQMTLPDSDRWRRERELARSVRVAVALFRMRLYIARHSIACVALGGKTSGWQGHMPGTVMELVLALLHRNPIYVVGGPGGMARIAGGLLGLDETWTGIDGRLLPAPGHGVPHQLADLFKAPGLGMPPTAEAAIEVLERHAIDGPNWPDNGLSASENRALFATDSPEEATRLVVKGLKAVFGAG